MSAEKVIKSEKEWKEQLSPEEYKVTRKKGTERAFTDSTTTVKSKAPITVSVVAARYLVPRPSSTLEPDGPVFGNPSLQRL